MSHGVQVSGRTGAMPAARVAALSGFLRAHTAGAADEVAVSAPSKAGPLIARDGRPVLILSDGQGNQLVSPAALAHAVAAGRVRYALIGDACTANSGNERTGCLPVVRWARAHGVDVSRAAGQPHRGALYALSPSGRRPRRQAAEELPRPPGRREGRGRRVGPRAAGPAMGLAVEAHVLDARPGGAVAPGDLGHSGCGHQPIRLALAAVDAPPLPQPPLHAAVEVGGLAAVGDDLVGGAVDLEDRQRALGLARRQRAVAAGDRGHAREALGELAPEPRRHARRRSTRP